jgi:hypothetical protein
VSRVAAYLAEWSCRACSYHALLSPSLRADLGGREPATTATGANLGADTRTGYRTGDVESGRYGSTTSYRDQQPVAGETRTYRDQPVVGHDDRSIVQKLTGQGNVGTTTETTHTAYRDQPVTHATRDTGIVA